jgi:alpha-1,3-mannosyltransferase
MQQVSLFVNGENDYFLLKGDTGPLVYPAFHLYIYSGLYYLTDNGTNIFKAQCVFALLYLCTLAIVLACYRRVGAPPWLLVPLVLSKRLHSIFLLRLFNDAWVTFFLWAAIYGFTDGGFHYGGFLWSAAVGVKMTALVAAPAAGVIVLQGLGTSEASFVGMYCIMIQLLSSFPFVQEGNFHYFLASFDFGRQFLYKWTVNWRFVGEEVFTSKAFATSLLVVHVSIMLFFLQTQWVKPSSSSILDFLHKYTRTMDNKTEQTYVRNVTPTFAMDTMLGSIAIGLLCARTLHYQFFAYLGWASPYLLWRAGVHPVLIVANLAAQEWAWLVYPSTSASSVTVVVQLIVAVVSAWFAPVINPPQIPTETEDAKVDAVEAEAAKAE